jgi:uncharacterized protein (TIGR03435 family)
VLAAIAGAIAFGAFHAVAQESGQPGAGPAFEVASVKLHVAGSGIGPQTPGTYVRRAASIRGLIIAAYALKAGRLVVGPDWIDGIYLDIDGKLPAGTTKEQVPRMLQALLADRLGLRVHRESRIIPVYELTIGKAGPKMKEIDPSKFLDQILRSPVSRGFRGHVTMPRLAAILSDDLDQYIMDSTGLTGIYDIDLKWSADEATATPPAEQSPQSIPAPSEWPHLFLAVQEQLGLKLEPRRAPVDVLVVDHVERVPTAN